MIAGGVSRLVFDCNRLPESPRAIPQRFEPVEVPGDPLVSADEQTGIALSPLLNSDLSGAGLTEEGESRHA